MRDHDTGPQPDLFPPPAVPAPVWTGDLKRAGEICRRWETEFASHADQGRVTAGVELSDLGIVCAAVSRLAGPRPDDAVAADPVAFLEEWLDGGRAAVPKVLTPGQGRALLDGIRARLAAAAPATAD